MDFEDLKTQYEIFKNKLESTDSAIFALVQDTKIFLNEYYKSSNIDEIFVDNLLLYLAFLESLSDSICNITCLPDYLNFQDIELPKAKIYYTEDYIKAPVDYDKDIYVKIRD